jgi:hypothetical protein
MEELDTLRGIRARARPISAVKGNYEIASLCVPHFASDERRRQSKNYIRRIRVKWAMQLGGNFEKANRNVRSGRNRRRTGLRFLLVGR